jgi:hypothetical protein
MPTSLGVAIKFLVLGGAAELLAVVERLLVHQSFTGVIAFDVAGILGTAFVPFAPAAVVAAFVRDWASAIGIGIAIELLVFMLMVMGLRLSS